MYGAFANRDGRFRGGIGTSDIDRDSDPQKLHIADFDSKNDLPDSESKKYRLCPSIFTIMSC